MGEFLLYYRRPEPTTWVYMSSFLTIGLYFVFHRFWSIRNLDIVLLILVAPGLLIVHEGRRRQMSEFEAQVVHRAFENETHIKQTTDETQTENSNDTPDSDSGAFVPKRGSRHGANHSGLVERWLIAQQNSPSNSEKGKDGNQIADSPLAQASRTFSAVEIQFVGFVWLFTVQALILIRLLIDPLMVRRPLLDPNLSTGGLNFIGISLFIFMMANVVTSTPRMQLEQGPKLGPGYPLMQLLPAIPTRPVSETLLGAEYPTSEVESQWLTTLAKTLAIFAHLGIVIGMVLIGEKHFANLRAGIGCAVLYLLLPYTAQMTGRADHALPSALLLWAVLFYRKPTASGIFLGLAAGLVYYPLFLLPLWLSFYWQRGVRRFIVGLVGTLTVLMLFLSIVGTEPLLDQLRRMYGIILPSQDPRGIWSLGWHPVWRYPVIAGFAILSGLFAVWPTQKNLGTLISCTAAVLVAAQFWHADGGGMYIAWFLPLLLLTIFRPNLQDRVALKVIDGGVGQIRSGALVEAEAA